MIFSSLEFIYFFLPVFLLLYFLVPWGKKWSTTAANFVLFAGSLYFYAAGEPVYVFLMLGSIAINYICVYRIAGERNLSQRGKQRRKRWFTLALVFNLSLLFLFKYAHFFVHELNRLLFFIGKAGDLDMLLLPEPSLENPVGISFYTFQLLSYVIDVYYRKYAPERNVLKMGTYITMFPQLIAGPIVVWPEVREQMNERHIRPEQFDRGVKTFILGLGAKVLIANRIGTLWTDLIRIGYDSVSTPLAWMGSWAYSFQIYFDFYGYSLMAIGLGRMLGFELPENFRDPYVSRSATEFWRRWHITLGRWFKEYLYIPLGGNRCGKLGNLRNIFLVWLFTGLWHGAAWNFLIWGLLFFLLLMLERSPLGKRLRGNAVASRIYMLLLIPLSWTVFAITELDKLGLYFTRLFPFLPRDYVSNVSAGDWLRYGKTYALSFLPAILFCIPAVKHFLEKFMHGILGTLLYLLIFFAAMYCLALGMDNPFLYYRF
ncbi:MAG: MBOAT family protein [Lachnospiraceae bacterium]|nr:MBOAT family protein [Lachnospiraceae bacterium]